VDHVGDFIGATARMPVSLFDAWTQQSTRDVHQRWLQGAMTRITGLVRKKKQRIRRLDQRAAKTQEKLCKQAASEPNERGQKRRRLQQLDFTLLQQPSETDPACLLKLKLAQINVELDEARSSLMGLLKKRKDLRVIRTDLDKGIGVPEEPKEWRLFPE
jgi:hypothetical protein